MNGMVSVAGMDVSDRIDLEAVLENLSDAVNLLKSRSANGSQNLAISAIARAIEALNNPFGVAPRKASGGLAGWQAEAIRRYVEAKMHSRISITEMADSVRLSPSHFCRSFRASFQCSPTQFIMKQRVERARLMLLETSEPLSQIAFECGFSDQSHFSRIFHETTGETPWRWRKERRDGLQVE